MTFEEINNLSLEDVIFQVLQRMMTQTDWDALPEGENFYTVDVNKTLPEEKYGLSVKAVTPSEILAEFDAYKVELTQIEQARLDEIARVEDIKTRWEAMDARMISHRLGFNVPNLAIELKRIIKEDDQIMLSNYEAENSVYLSEKSVIEYKEKRKKDYEAGDLHFDVFVEMLIEEDEAGMANYRAKRNAIKLKHPKP